MPLSVLPKEKATDDQCSFMETAFADSVLSVGGQFFVDNQGMLFPGFEYPYEMKDGTTICLIIAFRTVTGEPPISTEDACVVLLEVAAHSIYRETTSSVSLRRMMTTPNDYIVYATVSTVLAESGSSDLLARIEREMIDDLLVDDMGYVDPDDLREQVWRSCK